MVLFPGACFSGIKVFRLVKFGAPCNWFLEKRGWLTSVHDTGMGLFIYYRFVYHSFELLGFFQKGLANKCI